MTNREKYIIKRNEYDLMMTIASNAQNRWWEYCPIRLIGGGSKVCPKVVIKRDCEICVQKWLNEEAE